MYMFLVPQASHMIMTIMDIFALFGPRVLLCFVRAVECFVPNRTNSMYWITGEFIIH